MVSSSKSQQFIVRTTLDDLALVKNDDLVGCCDGRQAMTKTVSLCAIADVLDCDLRDGDGCASGCYAFQSILDLTLGVRIERSGGFVKKKNACILENSTSDGNLQTLVGSQSRSASELTLCRSPPDNFNPRSPTLVSYPSGKFKILSWIFAALQASNTSSSVASGRAYSRLYMMSALNSTVSCGTTPMFLRRLSNLRSRRSWPSMVMDPSVTS